MKTNFTLNSFRSLFLTFGLAVLSLNMWAQTTVQVNVANYSFSPKNVNITVGDQVVWTNTGGFHNVDGQKSVFPNNPESFGNSLGSGWTYSFTFNTPGTYNYHCDPHASFGMTGTIVVSSNTTATSESLADNSGRILLYPNPASKYIELKLPSGYSPVNMLKIYTLAGAVIDQQAFPTNSLSLKYDISKLNSGIYFIEINSQSRKDVLKFIKQ
jgi:plastocyanin